MDVLVCAECREWSDHEARGWTAFIGEDVDGLGLPEVVIFCPDCATTHFDYTPRRRESERDE